ncbi:MAG: hypothetical protein GY737_00310 [Desulfobacteraceae bacterium]|nr:hypothetical protein [Desulfobacteraceae bacterium]
MANIRNDGIYASEKASGGLYRGAFSIGTTAGTEGVRTTKHAVPLHLLSSTSHISYFNDFLDGTTDLDLTSWEPIDVGTVTADPSTFIRAGVKGGVLRLIGDGGAVDGNWISHTGDDGLGNSVVPTANDVIVFEARVTHSDWDAHHWFVGLIEDVGATAGMDINGDIADLEFVGFHHNDDDDADGIPRLVFSGGNTAEDFVAPQDRFANTITLTAGTDDTYRRFGIRIEGTSSIEFYIDGVYVGGETIGSAFTAPLYIGFGSTENASVADTLDIDWVFTSQTR